MTGLFCKRTTKEPTEEGQALNIVYGANRVSGNLVWYGDLRPVDEQKARGP